MSPYITVFGVEIESYLLMAGIGIVAASIFVVFMAKREKQSVYAVITIFLFVIIGVLIGGRIVYVIVNIDRLFLIIEEYNLYGDAKTLFYGMMHLFSGQVFYGGLYGGFLALYLYTKASKMDTSYYLQTFIPVAPLFHMFGRTGCFLAGCCYGVPIPGSSFSLFMNGGDVARVPTQLIEVCFNILLFVILMFLQKKDALKTHLFKIYLLSYSLFRFTIEFWRGDVNRGVYGDFLSTSQIIALLTIAVVSAIYAKNYLKRKKQLA